MTREKAIDVLKRRKTCMECVADWTCKECDEAFEMAIKTLEQTRWIPIERELPEIQQDVLLSLRSLDIEVGFRAKTEPYFYCHGVNGYYIEPQNVLAWMPLPQPYKAESEENNG